MKWITIAVLLAAAVSAQAQSWERQGSVKRWIGGQPITGPYVGCATLMGDPTVQTGQGLSEVALTSGTPTSRSFPEGSTWYFLPRQPRVGAQVITAIQGGPEESVVRLRNLWTSEDVGEVTIPVRTSELQLDQTDTWVSEDGSQGCVVFSPKPSTPDSLKEYVFAFFTGSTVTFTQRVKPKVDVDLYVRPTDEGILVYLRGNGMSFPPSTEEVFTNASYIVYQADGSLEQLRLDQRGPGSGRGRKIIWHSNKWDRLVLIDEFASGAMLVKASNGIFVDSITTSKVDPNGAVKILSASGNNRDTWMATHANVGSKNVMILWAMPDVREVTSIDFGSDNASKQMPLSDWDIIIPYMSNNGDSHTLFYWDPADVVSVSEQRAANSEQRVFPNPAADIVNVSLPEGQGALDYVIVDAVGTTVLRGTSFGTIDISPLPAGAYTIAGSEGRLCARLAVIR